MKLEVRQEKRDARRRDPAQPAPARAAVPSQAAVLALQRTAGNRAVAQMLQRYVEVPTEAQTPEEWPAGGPVRVSDDGTMAVRQDSGRGSHALWAAPDRIAAADAALAGKGSRVRLGQGSGTLAGTTPEYEDLGIPQRAYLVSVEPRNEGNETSGTTMDLYADCGRAAREVMGVGGGGLGPSGRVRGEWTEGGRTFESDANQPEQMATEIIDSTLSVKGSFAEPAPRTGWDRYRAMTPEARERFDAEHGINRYVSPEVGEAFVMDSGGVEYPGPTTWNFHWAAVLMTNGEDHVTIENFGVANRPWVQNEDWNFQMYGSPGTASPTFHDEHLADQEHGDEPMTMRGDAR